MNQIVVFSLTFLAVAFCQRSYGQSDELIIQASVTLVNHSAIAAKESGVLRKISCREGKSVKQGAPLFHLDDRRQELLVTAASLNLQIAQMAAEDQLAIQAAQAQVEAAEAEIKATQVALKIAEAEAKSKSAIEIAQADRQLREHELERAQKARDSFKGSISVAQLDRLGTAVQKGTLEIQQAKDEAAMKAMRPDAERANLLQLQQQVARYKTLARQEEQNQKIAQATAQVRHNELQIAKLNKERRQATAPFDGLVVKIEKREGEWVEQGAPIVRVIDLKTLRAQGFVQISQASQSLVGRSATVKVRVQKQVLRIPAKITFVSPEVDPANQQCAIWAEFDNSKFAVNPGVPATIELSR